MKNSILLSGYVGKTQDEKNNCAVILDEENQKIRNAFLKDLKTGENIKIRIYKKVI